MERTIELTLNSELASALVVLREGGESLEATATRVIVEARRSHVSESPAEGPSDEAAVQR